jgi:ribosomal protein S6
MSKEPMPAAEAANEVSTYELAFHVLPTVAEGEVTAVTDAIKSHITTNEGTVLSEEVPARFELAYEIIKHLEGRNRKFTSAYFGWIRFTLAPDQIEAFTAEVEDMKEILRAMTIKLTKVEEENPFYFHESIEAPKGEEIIEVPAVEPPETTEESIDSEEKTEAETEAAVDSEKEG